MPTSCVGVSGDCANDVPACLLLYLYTMSISPFCPCTLYHLYYKLLIASEAMRYIFLLIRWVRLHILCSIRILMMMLTKMSCVHQIYILNIYNIHYMCKNICILYPSLFLATLSNVSPQKRNHNKPKQSNSCCVQVMMCVWQYVTTFVVIRVSKLNVNCAEVEEGY